MAANNSSQHIRVGKRLGELLKKGSTCKDTLTTCVDAARKASDRGFISISEYRDAKRNITADPAVAVSCSYVLTDEGKRLQSALVEGAAAVGPGQNDPQLARLLEQTARSVYRRYGEPDQGFDCGDELNELATKWVAAAAAKLELPGRDGERFYVEPRPCPGGPILAQSVMQAPNTGLDMCFYLLRTYHLPKGPLFVLIELNVQNEARSYFARVLADYPIILQDIFEYSGMLKFENPVGLNIQPKRGASIMEFLRVYASQLDQDAEEHFMLQFEAYDVTTRRNINRAITALIALYDAASVALDNTQPSERNWLLRHHARLIGASAD